MAWPYWLKVYFGKLLIEVWHDLIPLRYEFTPGWYGYVLLQITSQLPTRQLQVNKTKLMVKVWLLCKCSLSALLSALLKFSWSLPEVYLKSSWSFLEVFLKSSWSFPEVILKSSSSLCLKLSSRNKKNECSSRQLCAKWTDRQTDGQSDT